MASGNMMGIGSSALLAFQRSLSTTGHNIANANTEGYSRQVVDMAARKPQSAGYGFIGTGVDVDTVRRVYDGFVENQVRAYTTSSTEFDAFHSLAVQVDSVLADPDIGMNSSLQSFFNAAQDVADDPASAAARQVLLSEGQLLADRFNELGDWINDLRGQIDNQLHNAVSEINRLSHSIADINQQIMVAQGTGGGHAPNDLLDQRDTLVRALAEHVSVSTLEQEDGALNVMVGTGQMLVRGSSVTELTVRALGEDPRELGVALKSSSGTLIPITEQLSGGRIGGVLGFRDRVLDQTANTLGQIAISVGHFVNEQHASGMDLDGALGTDFFNIAQPQLLPATGNSGSISVDFADVAALTNADYKLRFDGGSWDMTRTDTGQSVSMTGSGTAADPFIADGLNIVIGAAAANGDRYLIQPVRNGAADFQMRLTDTRQIAAAAPVRSNAALANNGSGTISAGTVTDIDNAAFQTAPGQLSPPLLMRFTGSTSYDVFDNSNPASPVLLETGIAFDPSTGADVFPTPGGLDFGYSVRLTGAPAAGDEFTLEYNTGGTGDNRNALMLAGLSVDKLLGNGSESFSDTYRSLVVDVGTGTRQAELNSIAQQQLLNQVSATRESISGVNLDEEAANLVRFQQAYQAAAQVIATADTMFNSLLDAVRR